MRTVKLFWKSRVTLKRKADIVRYTKIHYDEVKDCGGYLRLKAPRNDTKFVWIFMLSKTFRDLE